MKTKTILLIDDDTSLLVTLRDFLAFEGYQVVTASSGEEGLERLEGMTPDLIVLDMSMPGMGGMGFLQAISPSGKPHHPVLVLTARSGMAEYFGNVQVEGFVAKPCDPRDLLMEVGRIIFLTSADADIATPSRRDVKVLIGENRADVLKQLVSAMDDAGYQTVAVDSAAEVIEKTILEQPDVVILKLIFANMNGDTVARMLKEMPKTQRIPVILYDDGDVPAERYALDSGAINKFVSGGTGASLLAAVEDVIGGSD